MFIFRSFLSDSNPNSNFISKAEAENQILRDSTTQVTSAYEALGFASESLEIFSEGYENAL